MDNARVRLFEDEVLNISTAVNFSSSPGIKTEGFMSVTGFADTASVKKAASVNGRLAWSLSTSAASMVSTVHSFCLVNISQDEYLADLKFQFGHGSFAHSVSVYDNVYHNCPNYNAHNTSSATSDYVECPLYLCPGSKIRISTDDKNKGGEYFEGPINDPYIRLVDSKGSELAYNDDFYSSYNSQIEYQYPSRAEPHTGTNCSWFYLRQGCYGSSACKATSRVSVSVGGKSIRTKPQMSRIFQSTSNGTYGQKGSHWLMSVDRASVSLFDKEISQSVLGFEFGLDRNDHTLTSSPSSSSFTASLDFVEEVDEISRVTSSTSLLWAAHANASGTPDSSHLLLKSNTR